MGENDILIDFDKTEVRPKEEINGVIKINYLGRFDSIVINSQIENTRQDLKDASKIRFVVTTDHVPQVTSNAKFRASIIQEHKEVANHVAFLKILP